MRTTFLSRVVTVVAIGAVAMARPAAAQNVIWWVDANSGTNVIPAALAGIPGLTVYNATSQADFNSQLAANPWDLAIFGEQGNSVFAGSAGVLQTFLLGGGKVIGASWKDGGSGMAAFFQATITGTNESTISGSGALFAGVTSPVHISNPGWGVFSEGATGAGNCLASFEDASCAALEGNGGNTLLLGPLFDTYGSGADRDNGTQFVQNSVTHMLDGTTATPEPATLTMFATGFAGLVGVARRRKARSEA